jgi:hypothetical protein
MTRTKFRRFWLITLALMLGAAMYAHDEYENTNKKVGLMQKSVDRLTAERRSGSQITASLADLDSRTVDQKFSTRLDLLRYLGLEESRLKIDFSSPSAKRIGKAELNVRKLQVDGTLPYEEALNQLDYFYNTKKVAIKTVNLNAIGLENYDDTVKFSLTGEIYGLRK